MGASGTSNSPTPYCCTGVRYTVFDGVQANPSTNNNPPPPDTQVAAGTNDVVEMTNHQMRITDKTGGLIKNVGLATFFQPDATHPEVTDPKVVYDRFAQLFYATELVFNRSTNDSVIQLAVSKTADPAGEWRIYQVHSETGVLMDQPKLGISRDKIVIDWNKYTGSEDDQTYQGDETAVIDSAEAAAYVDSTLPLDVTVLDVGQNRTLPIINADTDLSGPLDAYEVYYHKNLFGGSVLTVRTITGVPANGSGVSTSTSSDIAIGDIADPPAGIQPGTTSAKLETGYDIAASASFRTGTLSVSSPDACQPNGQPILSCARVIRLTNANSGSPTKSVDTDFYTKNSSLMYPAVTLDENNDTFITFSLSSASLYPSVEMLAAPLGSTSFSGALVRLGDGPIPADNTTDNTARFGDYSGIGIDGSDPTRVWVAGEYGPAPSTGYLWGTSVAEYGFF